MKRVLNFFSLFLALFTTVKSYSCDCLYSNPFLKSAYSTKFIALVKVTKYLSFKEIYESKTPMSMEVEIFEIYKGIETRKKIIVWGDPGHLCRPYLSTFKEGKFYLIAFDAGNPNSGHEDEKLTDYSIANCGVFWLTVNIKKKIAIGNIDNKDGRSQIINLLKLKARLKNGH